MDWWALFKNPALHCHLHSWWVLTIFWIGNTMLAQKTFWMLLISFCLVLTMWIVVQNYRFSKSTSTRKDQFIRPDWISIFVALLINAISAMVVKWLIFLKENKFPYKENLNNLYNYSSLKYHRALRIGNRVYLKQNYHSFFLRGDKHYLCKYNLEKKYIIYYKLAS